MANRIDMLLADQGHDPDTCEMWKLRWSRLFGQFGGEVKLIPGFDYAASWSVASGGASPATSCISFAP